MVKILVVEDEPMAQLMIKRFLTTLKHEVVTASSAFEALEKVTEDLNFIFMDIGLPEGYEAGIDATKKIRAKGGRFSSIPIIALTANKDQEMMIKMIEAGANDYLNKPVSLEKLADIIKDLSHPHAA